MNLLPKCHEDFSKADYWNTFFKKRGKKSFEWYGEYPELCGVLSKFVKTKDDILVVGCGNSTLSMDLHDVGYRNITSIDISKIVIDQMRDKNRLDKRDLIFEQMDATSMSYPDDKFSVIIDKGTLDALMPDTSNETQKTIDRFFSEVARVLRRGGRYICISLLQEHILRKFIEFFASKDFMLRITRCHEAENKTREEEGSAIPVFAIMATKFPGLSQKVLELALTDNSSAVRIPNEEELINSILAVQQSALVCDRLSKKSVADVGEVNLDLYSPGNDEPKYTIYVLDRPGARGKTYAAFLVPQGRETDWLFATPGGRKHFLENVDKDRVAIVILGRNHIFKNWDEIKIELASSIKNLSPPGLPANYVIDYLSLGADVGKRELLHQGESKYSGKYLIEDVISDDENSRTRRLIFMDNKFVVQSEAEMKLVKSRRGKSKFVVNPGVLAGEYHAQICVAVNSLVQDDEKKEILVIGLGGGGLCLFLRHCYPKMNITAVDIDESMLEIATNWFDFVLDDKTKVKIEDGIKYLENARMENKKFDGIIFDVDGKDPSLGMCCPPVQFLDALVLENVRKCLNKNGMFILNFVCRDKSLRPGVLEKLRNQFTSVTSMKMKVFLNEVFVAQNDGKRGEDEWRKEWKESVDDLNRKVRNKKLLTSDVIDATELLDELTIEA